ncbi:MAG: hypothetical protein LM581_05730 [Desulfurococcales archaeon]|nr:hypothetical protein [Desulfurococcales archaeon]
MIKIYRIIDLHEDVAYFFQSASSEHVKDFDKDLPDRHADIQPKASPSRAEWHLYF